MDMGGVRAPKALALSVGPVAGPAIAPLLHALGGFTIHRLRFSAMGGL
jgi:hypothetical protein